MSAFICRVLCRLYLLLAVVVATSVFADGAEYLESQDSVRIPTGPLMGSSQLSRNFFSGRHNVGFGSAR